MKLTTVFTCLVGVAAALQPGVKGALDTLKRAPRPKAVGIDTRSLSASAPEGITFSTASPTLPRSKAGLTKLASSKRRRQLEASGPADFFECRDANPAPNSDDCRVLINHLLASDDEYIIAANTCLVLSYGTCQAFFCALCDVLSTNAEFFGEQIELVDLLCVGNGQTGAVVGTDDPQWSAGLIRPGQSIPTYDDVC